ncbi:MAG: hypothetical protein K9W44_09865 [Candidatus Lokiarchaeota archaeon]|nr:hypothetical protein [Candidatus Harpocratesius repetitus]
MFQSKIDQVKVDFVVNSANTNTSLNLDRINSLSDVIFNVQYFGMTAIPSKNFSQHIDFQERWFNDVAGNALVEKLVKDKNVIIPQKMVELGYLIGTTLTVKYRSTNSSMEQITLNIIGSYNAFPLISSRYSNKNILVVDEKWVKNASISELNVVFYPQQGHSINELISFQYTEFFWDLNFPRTYIQEIKPIKDDVENISQSSIFFFQLELFYLISLVVVGIMIIMSISVKEKANDIGVMRARGVSKITLYKIQLVEGFTLILLSLVFSIFGGILVALGLIIQLNHLDLLQIINMMYLNSLLERTMVIPWGILLIELFGSILLFISNIFLSVRNVIKKSDIGNIGNLLRVP